MATLKRQREDGNWEYLQMTGEDVITLKNDVGVHLADEVKHLKAGEREKWNKGVSSETITATGDWNNYIDTGFYMGQKMLNVPEFKIGDNDWWYVQVIKHNDNWCVQTAWNFNDSKRKMSRSLVNSVWTQWENAGGSASEKTFTVASGKTVNKGEIVAINKEGKIQPPVNNNLIPDFAKYSMGQAATAIPTEAFKIVLKLTDELAVFGYGYGSLNVRACNLTSDDKMVESAVATIGNVDSSSGTIAVIDDKRFFYIVRKLDSGADRFEFGVGTVNGSPENSLNIAYSDLQKITFPANGSPLYVYGCKAVQIAPNKILISYKYQQGSEYNIFRLVTWTGSSLVLGDQKLNLAGSNNATNSITKLEDNKALIVYANNNFTTRYVAIVTTYNDVIAFGERVQIESYNAGFSDLFVINSTRALMVVNNYMILLRVNSDNTITEISRVKRTSDDTICQLNSTSFLMINYASKTIGNFYYDTDRDILINIDKEYISSEISSAPDATWVAKNRVVVLSNYTSEFLIGDYRRRYDIGYFRGDKGNNDNLIGIATETKTAGQQCSVAVSGVVDRLTGIAPGADYISQNGKLVQTWAGSPYKLAKGISDTEILLQ